MKDRLKLFTGYGLVIMLTGILGVISNDVSQNLTKVLLIESAAFGYLIIFWDQIKIRTMLSAVWIVALLDSTLTFAAYAVDLPWAKENYASLLLLNTAIFIFLLLSWKGRVE